MATADSRSYRFHPLERRGVIVGLQPNQLVALGGGTVIALAVLHAWPGPMGVLGGLLIAGVAVAGAGLPLAGRPPVAWVPVAARWLSRRPRRLETWRPGVPLAPSAVTLLAGPQGSGEAPLGVVRDASNGLWSAVVPVRGESFVLLDREDQQRRLGAWGAVLAAAGRSGSPVRRIQWFERTVNDGGDRLAAYLASAPVDGGPPGAIDSYRQVLAEAGSAGLAHEVLILVGVQPRRAAKTVRTFGGGAIGTCALLRREVRLLQGQLRAAELVPAPALSLAELAGVFRSMLDPAASGASATPSARDPRGAPAETSAWPMAIEEHWDAIRVDRRWQATFWVAEWPRVDIGADFLAPLLLVGGTRVASVVMEPVPPGKARRQVESARTADVADDELRRRAGFLPTAHRRREAEGVVQREAELADGHGDYRYSGYVTVSAASAAALEDACAATEQAAQQSRIELRRLYGQQRDAAWWTLPIGRGLPWAPPAPPAHRATTANLQAVYPFVAGAALGHRGSYLGRDLHGGPFCFDPWELYDAGTLTSPNLLVVGQIGRGKSTFVKTLVWRLSVFGRQAWIIDPKGEYDQLARAFGSAPLRLVPDGDLRLNPLDAAAGPGDADVTPVRRRTELLCSIGEASLGRHLSPPERTATELGVRAASDRRRAPTVPDVVEALLDPLPQAAAMVRTDRAGLAADGRAVALELRRLVQGDLAGMFDGPTSPEVRLDTPLVVLDLSALHDSPALGILMTCATAWLQAALRRSDGVKRLVVVDEAWAILHDQSTARWLQASFKLSRAFGVANVAVVHRLSDLQAAGADGSSQRSLAQGLLADAETRVIFGQPPSELATARVALGLTQTEADLVGHLPRGVALWKVGDRSVVVEHAVGGREAILVDTDAAMRPA